MEWEVFVCKTILGSLYTDNTTKMLQFAPSPGSYFEKLHRMGLGCCSVRHKHLFKLHFDGVDNSIPDFYTQVCPKFQMMKYIHTKI